jgi:hypothetical protein
MSKHTPGPWRVKKNRPGQSYFVVYQGTKGQPTVAAVHESNVLSCVSVNQFPSAKVNIQGNEEIARANARLIAASPEMLEFLKQLAAEKSKSTQHARQFLDRGLEKVIAKAEGVNDE